MWSNKKRILDYNPNYASNLQLLNNLLSTNHQKLQKRINSLSLGHKIAPYFITSSLKYKPCPISAKSKLSMTFILVSSETLLHPTLFFLYLWCLSKFISVNKKSSSFSI